MWRNYYADILNSVIATLSKPELEGCLSNVCHHDPIIISSTQVMAAIHKLKNNSSPGLDELAGENFIHAHELVSDLACVLFNDI